MGTILLIENDPAKLVAQSLILRGFGHTVLEAGDRGEAWRICRKHRKPVHIVITRTDGADGSISEFVARLQQLYPQICALFLSDGISSPLADRQSLDCQYALLQKSSRLDTLADSIKALLAGPKRQTAASAWQ